MIQSQSQRKSKSLSQYLLMAMVALLIMFSAGCKSKKQAGDISDADAEKAKMEQEARQRELEAERRRAEEERLAREKARAEAEAAAAAANKPENKLADYFEAIANASSTSSANSSINEALTLFSSPDAPVLIVISQSGSQKDYDRPTTIKEYLNYLKDQKKNVNRISDLQFDASGKIKEVELAK